MRLVDADDLEKRLHELALDKWNQRTVTSWSKAYLKCENMVYNAQTVDAVEIVRCKDCKWFEPEDEDGDCWCYCNNDITCRDGYCSWGEKKDDK